MSGLVRCIRVWRIKNNTPTQNFEIFFQDINETISLSWTKKGSKKSIIFMYLNITLHQ